LDFVKISNAPDSAYDGVWQVIEVVSTSHIVIDAPYTATSLAGAAIQFYYNNYQVKVKVYAGLPAAHPWEEQKPYEEVAELSLTPDEDNLTMFSIADYIKGKVAIKNNPTLFSMPLNLDAFTGFYISTAESYDVSDGYTIGEEESAYSSNSFEGYAIAGKLPFKNTYSGHYGDYVYVLDSPAMWLTLMERLLAVEDKYFDLSFVKNTEGDYVVRVDKYIADYLADSEETTYTDQGIGVYRIPVEPISYYDSFCVTVYSTTQTPLGDLSALTAFATQSTSGSKPDWTTGAEPTVTLHGLPIEFSERLWANYAFIDGSTYTITVDFTVTLDTLAVFGIYILDTGFTVIDSGTTVIKEVGTHSFDFTFTATASTTKIAFSATESLGNTTTVTINSYSGTIHGEPIALTEEICIDILESCEATQGFTPTDIRLLEDGSYRILE
jgi:hypothetical protein